MSIYDYVNFKAAVISLSVAFPFEWWRRWWSYNWRRWSLHYAVEPYTNEPAGFRPTELTAMLSIQRHALEAQETRHQMRAAKRYARRSKTLG